MKNKNHIPLIHNYCDRWCERCGFTKRCAIYIPSEKEVKYKTDGDNKAFWNKLNQNFTDIIEQLQKAAKEHGYDFESPEAKAEQEKYVINHEKKWVDAHNHPIAELCKKYEQIAQPFIEKSEGMVDRVRELTSELHIGIKTAEEIVNIVADIGDCFDIIGWYVFFIEVKFQRALMGKLDGEEWEKPFDKLRTTNFPKDSDGSAKIALIAVERSMEAWAKFFQLLPSAEDTALDALSILSQIKKKGLDEFPNAMIFHRAGFDN